MQNKTTLHPIGFMCPNCSRFCTIHKSTFYNYVCGDTIQCTHCNEATLIATMTVEKLTQGEKTWLDLNSM